MALSPVWKGAAVSLVSAAGARRSTRPLRRTAGSKVAIRMRPDGWTVSAVSPVGCSWRQRRPQARCSAVSRVGLPPGPGSWTEATGERRHRQGHGRRPGSRSPGRARCSPAGQPGLVLGPVQRAGARRRVPARKSLIRRRRALRRWGPRHRPVPAPDSHTPACRRDRPRLSRSVGEADVSPSATRPAPRRYARQFTSESCQRIPRRTSHNTRAPDRSTSPVAVINVIRLSRATTRSLAMASRARPPRSSSR
jgi:hypothetical protein